MELILCSFYINILQVVYQSMFWKYIFTFFFMCDVQRMRLIVIPNANKLSKITIYRKILSLNIHINCFGYLERWLNRVIPHSYRNFWWLDFQTLNNLFAQSFPGTSTSSLATPNLIISYFVAREAFFFFQPYYRISITNCYQYFPFRIWRRIKQGFLQYHFPSTTKPPPRLGSIPKLISY